MVKPFGKRTDQILETVRSNQGPDPEPFATKRKRDRYIRVEIAVAHEKKRGGARYSPWSFVVSASLLKNA